MQGVQGYLKSGRTKQAAYEEYSVLGRCPECREGLVCAGEEGGELVCSYCGIVVGRADSVREIGSSAPSGSKSEPLGSFIVADASATPSLKGPAFGWAKLMPNIVGRGGPLLTCSQLTERVSGRFILPKSVVQNANLTARRLLPGRKAYGATIPAVSAYSLLYACKSAGITHVGFREILEAYSDAGHRVSKAQLLRIGLESSIALPHSGVEDLVRAAVRRLQSNEEVGSRIREAKLDRAAYFTRLFELAKEVAAKSPEFRGFSPRTLAAGSVYLANLGMQPKMVRQREAAETLGLAEYTVREFCGWVRKETETAESQVRLVKSGPGLRRS